MAIGCRRDAEDRNVALLTALRALRDEAKRRAKECRGQQKNWMSSDQWNELSRVALVHDLYADRITSLLPEDQR
jgi:hypothetical protein